MGLGRWGGRGHINHEVTTIASRVETDEARRSSILPRKETHAVFADCQGPPSAKQRVLICPHILQRSSLRNLA